MQPIKFFITVIFLSLFAYGAHAAPRVITWDHLIPTQKSAPVVDFSKFTTQKGVPDVSEFDGSQEEMDFYLEGMQQMRQLQPQDGDALAYNLHGQEVKIAGYVTPLSFDGDKVVEFLFVPYLGACMHVPPPPANQIVYVENAEGLDAADLYDPVWLIGKLDATPVSTVTANVGYTIKKATIEPYTETQ